MSEKYKFYNEESVYFITPTIVGWIDLFTRKEYCDLVLNSLEYCQKEKGLVIHAWCIVPGHLHLISSTQGNEQLSSIVRGIIVIVQPLIIVVNKDYWKLRRLIENKVWEGRHALQMRASVIVLSFSKGYVL